MAEWSLPPLVPSLALQDMIDVDEAGIFVETANRKHGKAHVGCRADLS